jgi:hypothetical protein
MYNLNYTPTTLGVQTWTEIISGGTRTKKVEYHWSGGCKGTCIQFYVIVEVCTFRMVAEVCTALSMEGSVMLAAFLLFHILRSIWESIVTVEDIDLEIPTDLRICKWFPCVYVCLASAWTDCIHVR